MTLRFNQIMRALLASGGQSVPSFYLNLSSPTNVSIAGAQGRGSTTNVGGGNITARVSPSRTSGCAPLYVNFDAYGTTKVGEDNPDHTLFFVHSFGDSGAGAGTWANGVQSVGLTSKNYGYGPVSGHVYETPGTPSYMLTVMDGAQTKTVPGFLTILDPNDVYAGAKTICISNTGNFAGAPTGAQQINVSGTTGTDMYGAWNNLATKSDRRILFCKSDTWVASAVVSLQGLTGTYLSGYGTGVAHSFASGTLVTVTPNTGIGMMFEGGGSTDCKLCNFKIIGDASHYGAGATTASSSSLLFYKVEVRGATAGFSCTTGGSGAGLAFHDQHCIYECSSDQQYGYAANAPLFNGASGAVGTPGIFTATGHKFARFNKVRLVGTPPAGLTAGVDYFIAAANLTANTFSLNAARDTEAPLAISGAGTCDVTAISLSGGIGAFVSFRRGGFMGNYLDSCNNGEQTLRMPYLDRAHINNNYLARPNQTKNVLKIHCRGYDELIGYTSGYSEKMVITANVMDLRGGYSYNDPIPNNGRLATNVGDCSMVIGNGGPSPGGERVRNVIVQHNYTYSSEGNPKDGTQFVAANCPKFTVRNNIADFGFGSNRGASSTTPYAYAAVRFMSIATSTPDQTAYVRVYNNSLYSNIYNAEMAQFASISGSASNNVADVDDVAIKNNLWYMPFHNPAAPAFTRTALYIVSAAFPTNVVLANNTDNGQTSLVSPNFTVTPPVALADWKPASGSYAIKGSGTPPLIKDFNMATRTGGFDHIGAILP